METQTESSKPIINIETKVMGIFGESEFNQLTTTEKNYAYHFSRAAWEGSKICYFQTSYESPVLFHIFQHVFSNPISQLKKSVLDAKVSEDDWNKFCLYASTFLNNAGNYKSFGDTKFIPEVSEETFLKIMQCSESFKNEEVGQVLVNLWNKIKFLIFHYDKPFDAIGINPVGLTGYYSSDIPNEEIKIVNEFMKVTNLSPLNTRIGSVKDKEYVVFVASVNMKDKHTHYYQERKIHVVYGDFSSILRRVSYHLDKADGFSANKNQKKMLLNYQRHFNSGDIEHHKNSQRDWVKDTGPIIETNIGFIETYKDPVGIRAEFEGFVAVVNKQQSKQTNNVVENAEKFLALSPWPKEFEKDKFLRPDFTSLSVLTFGSSGTPLGINIPNYDDIRQDEGFKNVYLGNCIVKPKTVNYIDPSLADNLIQFYQPTIFHKVIYHELLGHGCGKLLAEDAEGVKNFDPCTINPLTGKPVATWYKSNETWTGLFGKWNNPYEECRADSVALYFSCFPEATEVLQPEWNANWKDIMVACFTEFISAGVGSLEFYNLETKKFSQAHVNGIFVILQVLLEAGNGFVTIEKVKNEEGKDWISIKMDKEQCLTTGFNAMKNFLLKLNVYKATADLENGVKMYEAYSNPSPFFLELREIILANKKPRRIEVQGNILKQPNSDELIYRTYPETFEGIIESFKQRFNVIDNEVLTIWEEGNEFFRPLTKF